MLHDFLEITAIAELHEDIVPCISFDGFPHFDHILRLDRILILYLTHYQAFLHLAELLTLNHFASVVL
jgi:hypothetical protein